VSEDSSSGGAYLVYRGDSWSSEYCGKKLVELTKAAAEGVCVTVEMLRDGGGCLLGCRWLLLLSTLVEFRSCQVSRFAVSHQAPSDCPMIHPHTNYSLL